MTDELKSRGGAGDALDSSLSDVSDMLIEVVSDTLGGTGDGAVVSANDQATKGSAADDTKRIIATAAKLAGSLVDDDLVICFNNDLFQDHVQHCDEQVGCSGCN